MADIDIDAVERLLEGAAKASMAEKETKVRFLPIASGFTQHLPRARPPRQLSLAPPRRPQAAHPRRRRRKTRRTTRRTARTDTGSFISLSCISKTPLTPPLSRSRDRDREDKDRDRRHRSRSRSPHRDRRDRDRDYDRSRDRRRSGDKDYDRRDRDYDRRDRDYDRRDRSRRDDRDRDRDHRRDDRSRGDAKPKEVDRPHIIGDSPPRRKGNISYSLHLVLNSPAPTVEEPKGPSIDNDDRDERTVFVQNMPSKATDKEIKEFFAQAGKVTEIRMITDKYSGKSKGYRALPYLHEH